MNLKTLSLSLIFALCCNILLADIQVYFSPNGGAQEAVIEELGKAKSEVLIQAYSFTSAPIARAIVEAHKRGVKVITILDKSNETAKYSAATFLTNQNIPVYIDFKTAIAHSKIMIIDRSTIITGSFNFTKNAEENNAENLLVITKEPELVKKYLANFQNRIKLSRLLK